MARDTRQKILEAAAELVQEHGYHGAGLADILDRSGAPRGSVYFHFPDGKCQIVAECTKAVVAAVTGQRSGFVQDSRTPGELLRKIGDSIAEVLEESDYRRSCPVSPLIFDGLPGEFGVAEVGAAALVEWMQLLQEAFVSWGLPGDRAAPLALLAQSTFQGAALIAMATRRADAAREAAQELATMIDREFPGEPGS